MKDSVALPMKCLECDTISYHQVSTSRLAKMWIKENPEKTVEILMQNRDEKN